MSERSVRDPRVCEILVDKVEQRDLGKWRSEKWWKRLNTPVSTVDIQSYNNTALQYTTHFNTEITL